MITRQSYAVLLRAIANVPMDRFRRAMEELGFADVESLGMSGNLLFGTSETDVGGLERRIGDRFRTTAFVRRMPELTRVSAQNPFAGRSGAAVLFLARAPTTARRREFGQIDFEAPMPRLVGKTVFFVHPTRLRGRRSPFDFERALGIGATARSARVVDQLLERLRRRS